MTKNINKKVATELEVKRFLDKFGEDYCDPDLFAKEIELLENIEELEEPDRDHPDYPTKRGVAIKVDFFDIMYAGKHIGDYKTIFGDSVDEEHYDVTLFDDNDIKEAVIDTFTDDYSKTNRELYAKLGCLSKHYIKKYVKV